MTWCGLAAVVLAAGRWGAFRLGGASNDPQGTALSATTVTTLTPGGLVPGLSVPSVTSLGGFASTVTRAPPTTILVPSTTTTTNPCSAPGAPRPANGAELRARSGSGRASLKVTNGTSNDAIVKLLSLDPQPSAALAVYVRASESFTISRVARSSYRVAFGQGTVWSDARKAFDCPTSAKVFDDIFDFTAGNWEITLNPVIGGTAGTDMLDPKSFAAL